MQSDSTRVSVEDLYMTFHQSVLNLDVDSYRELQRHYYATPTLCLELIQTYKDRLKKKRKDVHRMQQKLRNSQG